MAKQSQLRRQIALVAGRILAEQRHLSFEQARQKAAQQLGVDQRKHLPDNQEIEIALQEYQALFLSHRQPNALQQLREQAVNAMRLFRAFQPRLTGSVLSGSADLYTPVKIHLHTDSPEEAIFVLLNNNIPYEESDAALHYPDGTKTTHPRISFTAGEITIELTLLPHNALRNPPLNPTNKRPDKGASLKKLLDMMEQGV
ncbi:MAG: hypothetical protein MI754_06910 [Chromatiales bacterium]|nr:hypothetical protein [Chromatiales bacterium]